MLGGADLGVSAPLGLRVRGRAEVAPEEPCFPALLSAPAKCTRCLFPARGHLAHQRTVSNTYCLHGCLAPTPLSHPHQLQKGG